MQLHIRAAVAALLVAGSMAAQASIISYDFNADDGGFTVSTPAAWQTPWTWTSGSWQVNQDNREVGAPMTSYLTSATIVLDGALTGIRFSHRWSLESGDWDGAAVDYSLNGAAFSRVSLGCFAAGGYNGTVFSTSRSVLAGQAAFVNDSPDFAAQAFVTSSFNCPTAAAAGDTLQLRFVYAGDTNTRGSFLPSWQIDSLTIFTDGQTQVPEPGTLALFGVALAGACAMRRRRAA